MPENISSQFHRLYPAPIEDNRVVETILERDSIPGNVRWEGMHVYVSQAGEKKTYELRGGITNDFWEPISDIDIDVAVDIAFSETSTNPVQNQVITNGMYQRTQLQTSGQAQVHWDNLTNVPDLVEESELSNYQLRSEKGQANGYASLNASGVIPSSELPPVAITQTHVVNSEAEMLALDAQTGDVAVRTDINNSFILQSEPASSLGNWVELLTPGAPVQSVNGETGTVQLDLSFSSGSLGLTGSSAVNLDSRYYTESETDGMLAGKAPISGSDNYVKRFSSPVSGDLNDIILDPAIGSSHFLSDQSAPNLPFSGRGIIYQNYYSTGYGSQIAIGATSQGMWYRSKAGGTVNPFSRVWDDGNLSDPATETWVNSQGFLTSPSNLQQVLDAGDTATGNINLSGNIDADVGNITTVNTSTLNATVAANVPDATSINQALTAGNLGFGLSWNSSTNEIDWSSQQSWGATGQLHYIPTTPMNNRAFMLGDPNETGISPAIILDRGTSGADSQIILSPPGISDLIGTNSISMIYDPSGDVNYINLETTNIDFQLRDTVGGSDVYISATNGLYVDQYGITGSSNFSSNYTNNSYVQKTYVDQAEYLKSLPNYNATVEQVLGHDASGNLTWINN